MLYVAPWLVREVKFLKHVKSILLAFFYLGRHCLIIGISKDFREVISEEHLHEFKLQLKDCFDEFEVGRVEVVEKPGVIALHFSSHFKFLILLVLGKFDGKAVLLSQSNAKTLFLLLYMMLYLSVEEILSYKVVQMFQVLLLSALLLIHQELHRWVRKLAIKENA